MARFKPVSHRLVLVHGCLAQAAPMGWTANALAVYLMRIDFDVPRAYYFWSLSIGGHVFYDGRGGLCNPRIEKPKSCLFKFLFLLGSVCCSTCDTSVASKRLLHSVETRSRLNRIGSPSFLKHRVSKVSKAEKAFLGITR